jgi:hypothetical protein
MADDTSASIITLHQPRPKKAKTAAERAKAYRQRKRAAKSDTVSDVKNPQNWDLEFEKFSESELPAPAKQGQEIVHRPAPVTESAAPNGTVEVFASPRVTPPSRPRVASILLAMAALALAVVGMTMNGWFARSLGSTDAAGWLFLVIGVAADLVALVMPSCAAGLWQAGQRTTALAAWAVWLMTFVFAVTAGIGFASVNIADVSLARASRATPAVATAQAALNDAMTARDRECKGGVGKFCRERETAVAERRQALDMAMRTVEQTADPQTEAAIRIVAWTSRGTLRPSGDDFVMLRLVLLALLPQIGGILLMVGRVHRR